MAFRPQFAAIRNSFDITDTSIFNVVVSTASGGAGFTSGGTIYLGLQGQNRVGYNLCASLQAVTYTAGQQISITIGSNARTLGEDIHKFILCGATTNNPAAVYLLASYATLQNDQVTPNALPVTITLNRDEHLKLNQVVTNAAALPISSNLLEGMARGLSSNGNYYYYASASTATADGVNVISANTGRWLLIGSLSTAILGVDIKPGCSTALDDLSQDSDLLIKPPNFNVSGGAGTPINFWVANPNTGASEAIPIGTNIGLNIFVNNQLSNRLFSGKLKVIFRGFVNMVTGALDVSNADASGNMQYVNEITPYVYGTSPNLTLQKDLPSNSAFLFTIYPQCSAYEFQRMVPNGAALSIYPFFYAQSGEYNPIGTTIGSTIFAALGEARRIVPGIARSVIGLTGSGIISNIQFPIVQRQTVNSLVANSANQPIFIDGNGNLFLGTVGQTTPSNEALRALVSTVAGISSPSSQSSYVTVDGSHALQIVLNYPSDNNGVGSIRSTYPDVIANSAYSLFNSSTIRIYIQKQSDGTIYYTDVANLKQASETITLTALPSTTIGAIPTNSDPKFSLFAPISATPSQSTSGGTVTAGSYRISYAFNYDGNQVTAISHAAVDDCLPELSKTLADALANANAIYVRQTIPANNFGSVTDVVFVDSTGGAYAYNIYEKTAAATWTLRGNLKGSPGYSFGIRYNWESNISSSPTAGAIRLNNATYTSATTLYVSKTNRLSVTVTNVLNQLNTNSILLIQDENDPTAYVYGRLTASADSTTYKSLTIDTIVSGGGTFGSNVTLTVALAGVPGNAATIAIGTVTTGSAAVTNSGTSNAAVLNFSLPQGVAGSAATIAIGSVSALSAGSTPTVTNSGTSAAATLNFGIPVGANSYTTTTANFTQPASGSNVTTSFVSTAGFGVGQTIYITSGGYYTIAAIGSATAITLTNPTGAAYGGNAASGVTINNGSTVSPAGVKGIDGIGTGTVTSVTLTVPSVLAVSGSPITSSGTLALTFALGQTANQFLATPNGSTGALGLRSIATTDLPAQVENVQTGTTYTLVLADYGATISLNNSSTITLIVPTNASIAFPIGTQIILGQVGAGQVTVAAASGVTINSADSKLKTRVQYSFATLWKQSTNIWYLFGDLAS